MPDTHDTDTSATLAQHVSDTPSWRLNKKYFFAVWKLEIMKEIANLSLDESELKVILLNDDDQERGKNH